MDNIDFIFSEFNSVNHVNARMIQEYFPEAGIKIYNEHNTHPVFNIRHERYGWRMHDYQQLVGMLESKSEIVIALDADMKIINKEVRAILPLVKKFGLCIPCNPRLLVKIDTQIGTDSDQKLDDTQGTGYAFNSAIIALDKRKEKAVEVIQVALRIMKENPMRLPLVLWRAVYETGFFPCLLPPQWCVCETQEGCGNEIILHIGHKKVREFYHVPIAQ